MMIKNNFKNLLTIGIIGWMFIILSFNKEPELQVKEVIKYKVIKKEIPAPKVFEVLGTFYNPCANQCYGDPTITADCSKINLKKLKEGAIKWCALSRDLLKRWGGPYNYGDTILIHHSNPRVRGLWVVHDAMNKRFKRRVDFLTFEGDKTMCLLDNVLISDKNFYTRRDEIN